MDFVLIDGDKVLFNPKFGAAVVVPKDGVIKASGKDLFEKKKGCVEGDEKNVTVRGIVYMTPKFSIPGTGTLSIKKLDVKQYAKTKSGNKRLLVVGKQFVAEFDVDEPAKAPPQGAGSPIPDTISAYQGTGRFVSANKKAKVD
jgi:hypothetical protein